MLIKFSKFYNDLGICKTTAYKWVKEGKFKLIKSDTGRNFITEKTYNKFLGIKKSKEDRTVIYCRVSSNNQVKQGDLNRQAERMKEYCLAKGWTITKIIKEVGSGINDTRPKLNKLLEEGNFTRLVVEHKDRLTRFGFNHFAIFFKLINKELHVANGAEDEKTELIQDFISIITSFCARIYGARRTKRIKSSIIKVVKTGGKEK